MGMIVNCPHQVQALMTFFSRWCAIKQPITYLLVPCVCRCSRRVAADEGLYVESVDEIGWTRCRPPDSREGNYRLGQPKGQFHSIALLPNPVYLHSFCFIYFILFYFIASQVVILWVSKTFVNLKSVRRPALWNKTLLFRQQRKRRWLSYPNNGGWWRHFRLRCKDLRGTTLL